MKALQLPAPPWGVAKPRQPQPGPPPLVNEAHMARIASAEALAVEACDGLDPELVETARTAYVASEEAGRAVNSALAELRGLEALEADADDVDEATIAARIARKMV